jgi:hypothetical protein
MILAYRFARKKYQQRQAAKSSLAPVENGKRTTESLPGSTQAHQESHTNSNISKAPKKDCAQCKLEKSAARKYRWKLLFCLLPAFFDASLDLTIVATALPQIASHFGESAALIFFPFPPR